MSRAWRAEERRKMSMSVMLALIVLLAVGAIASGQLVHWLHVALVFALVTVSLNALERSRRV